MRIKRKFLKLTKLTYPNGTENMLENHLPEGYKKDTHGNYYISIGDNYTTMFTCHLDTASSIISIVTHKIIGQYIMTDGNSILGADDKAGMIVVLYMIEKKVPGLYYFFIGEECGCIGSSALSKAMENNEEYPEELKDITKVVSFDRRGTGSVITHQFYGRCCSDDFANDLSQKLNDSGFGLNMKPDDTGVLTDSAQFMSIIPECTNISVGYYNEHTVKEYQDIEHLTKLCRSVSAIDWESLTIARDPDEYYNDFYGDFYDIDTIDDNSKKLNEKEYSKDHTTFIVNQNKERVKVYLSQTRINFETLLIIGLLKKQSTDFESVRWDGTACWVTTPKNLEYLGSRQQLMQFIPELYSIPYEHIKYTLDEEEITPVDFLLPEDGPFK